MKIYIAADLEGTTAVVGQPELALTAQSKQYEFARRQLTREVNAAITGFREAGATEIVVDDAHGDGTEILIYDELLEGVKIYMGVPRPKRFASIDKSFSAMAFIGYHPMAGTVNGVLSHTYSTRDIHHMWLNGKEIGEIGLDAAVVGSLGIPVIFVSSCKAGAAEAEKFLNNVVTVAVKEGYGRNCALSLHPRDAVRLIHDGARKALNRLNTMKPVKIKPPYEIKTEYKLESMAENAARRPGAVRVDAKTVKVKSNDLFELI